MRARANAEPHAKLVRGPVVTPKPNDGTVETSDELVEMCRVLRKGGKQLAADLFCGAGGMSLGLQDAGFEVVVGVDNDPDALTTHASLFPGMHLDWDLGREEHVEELALLLGRAGVDLIAGGPPCQPFSKAGRSLIRDLVRTGRRPPEDRRRDLWQSFLAVVERVLPEAVLMENVPDMALDRDMLILRTMVDELERLDYSVEVQVIETSRYGVPQHRQRLILVALRESRIFHWPHEGTTTSAEVIGGAKRLWDAISDLPDVVPGWRSGTDDNDWVRYEGARHPFQERARENVHAEDSGRVFDHITRPVREDDLEAFQLLTSDMKYSDLPDHLKRYRQDIFDDKYKRLAHNELSRTITAHIAKDGYWYIHPEFHRTLTVREAARIQTFRDDIRFAGPPTTAFRQIGNAVPPLLAQHLGTGIKSALARDTRRTWTTRAVSRRLAEWVVRRRPTIPWLISESRWAVVQAEMLLHRAKLSDLPHAWKTIAQRFPDPEATLAGADYMQRLARAVGREHRAGQILSVAARLKDEPTLLDSYAGLVGAGVPAANADMACRLHPTSEEDPVLATSGTLRVAARFHGSHVNHRNKRSDGRIALARLMGVDSDELGAEDEQVGHLAHLAIFEIAGSICLPQVTKCGECPLSDWCSVADSEVRASGSSVGSAIG